jgi:hypothetical protein
MIFEHLGGKNWTRALKNSSLEVQILILGFALKSLGWSYRLEVDNADQLGCLLRSLGAGWLKARDALHVGKSW